MKKSIRSLFSLLLVLTLVLSLCGSALAADTAVVYTGKTASEDGKYSGNFEFTTGGFAYNATDLFDNFKNVMPGDTLTQKITFKNEAPESECDYVMLYLSAQPHFSEDVAKVEKSETEMLDFLAQLKLKITDEAGNVLFDDTADKTMAQQALGRIDVGSDLALTVELTVDKLMGNDYAHRMGEIDWVFSLSAFNETQLTVKKLWSDGNNRHNNDSVTVNLLKNGVVDQTVELNAENNWTYTFDKLDTDYTWTVEETPVPSGYTVSYIEDGSTITIKNTKKTTPVTPNPPTPSKPTPPEDEPKEEPKEEPETSDVYVTKVWEDDGVGRPGSVTLNLLKNGVVYDTVTITEAHGWAYAWTDLDGDYTWTVEEANVPEGYEVSYVVDGDKVTVTNSKLQSRTVKKVWSGDDEKSRPDAVNVTLYDGETAVETVQLGQWNDWTHTWEGLSASGNWQITETSIPKGYTPSYSVSGDVVTVTNTATLIQTGQLNWPIPVFGGIGVLLIVGGILLLRKKKEDA